MILEVTVYALKRFAFQVQIDHSSSVQCALTTAVLVKPFLQGFTNSRVTEVTGMFGLSSSEYFSQKGGHGPDSREIGSPPKLIKVAVVQ